MAKYSPAINRMVNAFTKLPGIGRKTAQRLCFHILTSKNNDAIELAEAILDAKKNIKFCSECCNITDVDPCPICSDPDRDHSIVCVVESPSDVAAIERSDRYKGLFHVLHGSISPANNKDMDDIKLYELMNRLSIHNEINEIILANNATVEGEATAMFIANLLQTSGIKVSKIANGIPVGSNLEYADELTLSRAIDNRQVLHESHTLSLDEFMNKQDK